MLIFDDDTAEASRRADMDALDRLPPDIRWRLCSEPAPLPAQDALSVLRMSGAARVHQLLDQFQQIAIRKRAEQWHPLHGTYPHVAAQATPMITQRMEPDSGTKRRIR